MDVCVRCKYFFPVLHKDLKEGDFIRAGVCRRYAPGVNGFPRINISDWCGEFLSDVDKLPPIPNVSAGSPNGSNDI